MIKQLIKPEIIYIYLLLIYGSMVASIVIPLLTDLELFYNINIDNEILFRFGTIEAFFIIISTFSLFFWGYVIDRLNRKFWALVGLLIIFSGTMIIILTSSIYYYIIGRFLMGIGLGVITPVSFSIAGDIINYESRSFVGGGLSIAIIAGSGIAIIIGGGLGSFDIFLPFSLILILTLILIIIILLNPEPIRGREEPELRDRYYINSKQMKENITNINQNLKPKSMMILLKRPTNILLILQGVFALIPSAMLTYFLISYLRDNRYGGVGLGLAIATTFGILIASGRLIGYLLWGFIGDKLQHSSNSKILGRGRVIVASITMAIQGPIMVFAFLISLPFLGNKPVVFPSFILTYNSFLIFGIVFFIAALVGGGSGPNRRSIAFDINEPELRGQAASLFAFGDQIGASIGLFVGNSLIIIIGYSSTFILLSLSYLLAAIFWLMCLRTIRSDQDELRKHMQFNIKNLKT